MPDRPTLLARGRMADVYAWDAGRVLKLFRSSRRDIAEYEARLTDVAGRAGLPAPAVSGIVEYEGRVGILLERLEGSTMLRHLLLRPWTVGRFGDLLASLQRDLHARSAADLPSLKERLRKVIAAVEIPAAARLRVDEVLRGLPEGEQICHGDFHPDNVLLTPRGPVIIDWIDAACGDPLADVARTLVLLQVGSPPGPWPVRRMIDVLRGAFRRGYIRRYFEVRPPDAERLARWIAVVAAARLGEGVEGEAPALLRMVEGGPAAYN